MTETWSPTEAAARGAAWLDEHDPGWAIAPLNERGINLKRLNLESCEKCILGQRMAGLVDQPTVELQEALAESYVEISTYRGDGYSLATDYDELLFGDSLAEPVVYELGFTVPCGWAAPTTAFRSLTAAWRTEIENRRAAQQRAESAGGERDKSTEMKG